MYINSLALQALVERVTSRNTLDSGIFYDIAKVENSQDYKFVQETTDAARKILDTAVSLAEDGILRYAPVRLYLRITSASIFLLKAISLGARTTEVQNSLNTLDRCIHALRSGRLDDIHLSSRYGTLIHRHVSRFRRNFRSQLQPRAVSTMPPVTSHGLQAREGNMAESNLIHMNHFATDIDESSIDEWLAQPFDPSLAPFGVGEHQSASGLELDSLDFLWNMLPHPGPSGNQ